MAAFFASRLIRMAGLFVSVACCGCSQPPDRADAPGVFLQTCMKEDYPAMLLKAESRSRQSLKVTHDETGDGDAIYAVTCRVLSSYKLEPKPGDTVVLLVPSGPSGDESGPAERTSYWFVSGPEGEEWMPKTQPELRFYHASALDFHGFDARKVLLPGRFRLQGVWREMADVVAGHPLKGEFCRAHANRLERIAPLEPPRGSLVKMDEALAIDCCLGEELYLYLKDFGSGLYVWQGMVYRKNNGGRWEWSARISFSSGSVPIKATLKGDVLTLSGSYGVMRSWSLAEPYPLRS